LFSRHSAVAASVTNTINMNQGILETVRCPRPKY
jgi:hypothetical protein